MSTPSSVMVFGIVFLFFLYACVRMAESEIASHTFADLFRKFAERPLAEKLFILVFVGMMVSHGGSKSTNSVPEGGGAATVTGANDIVTASTATNSVITGGAIAGGDVTGDFEEIGVGGFGMLAGLDPELPRLTTNQYLAGFALVSVSTNAAPWLTVPSNAVTHAPWVRYGVAEDTFWLPTNGWAFVLGTNEVDGAHISSSGTLSFGGPKGSPRAVEMPDGMNISFLAALQGSLGIVPPQGRFWHAPTSSNSLLCTWQDVCAGRDSNSVVSFQAELFWNGDFAYRYAFTGSPAFTNFVVGAQNRGGGETYALDAANLLASGLELHWRAFGMLDPGVEDHDGDGLSTYDEVMLYGTNPALRDTDHDGLEDADELAAGTNPRNPDSDGDGLADGIDPDPLVWDDPDGDAGGDGLGYLFEVIHGLDPAADNALDSDGDGWADWKELMAGTDPDDMSSVPVNIDGIQTQVPALFEATVTLNASLPCDALLRVGDRTVVLRQARSYTLTLVEGVAYPVSVAASLPCAVSLSATLSSPYAAFQNPGGVFSGGATVPGGAPVACGMIAQPRLNILPERVCFHSGAPKTVAAKVSPPMAGSHLWDWHGGGMSSVTGRSANISWDGGDSLVCLSFTASGAAQPRYALREVTRCAKADEDTWCDDHGCEHWYCACDNDDASGDDDCGFHGQKVSKCREAVCPTHHCPYSECPDGWCHRHGTWYSDCDGWWCHMHDRPLSECGHDEPPGGDPDGDPYGTGGGGDAGVGVSEDGSLPVNNDDGDADGLPDLAGPPSPSPDGDLLRILPLGPHDGSCCPCPEHRPQAALSAELLHASPRLALWADPCRSNAFGGTVRAGEAVWAEGLEASPSVGADLIVWRGTNGADAAVQTLTNRLTVLGVRLFGDIDLDGDADAEDRALHASLPPEGWCVPAAPGVLRPVRLRTDVGLSGGAYTLTLSGAGIRVWPDATGTNAPLLECGQTVTNGAGGVSFLAGPDTDLYIEAVSNGVAALTYAFAGDGEAWGLACSAALKMTAFSPDVCPDLDGNGMIDSLDVGILSIHKQGDAGFDALYRSASNTFHAVAFDLFGAAPMGNGAELRAALSGAEGAFRLFDDTNAPPLLVSTPSGGSAPLPYEGTSGPAILWLECVAPATGTVSCVYLGRDGSGLCATATVSFVAADIRLHTDTDNDGVIVEASGGEREFSRYAPGRLLMLHGVEDGTSSPSPRAETRFSLKPDCLMQVGGRVTLSIPDGENKVVLWDSQLEGNQLTAGTYNLTQAHPPATLWVSGVSTGTAVLAASYSMVAAGQAVSNLTAYTVIPPVSTAPVASNAYVWCSLPIELGKDDGLTFDSKLREQGFIVTWFEDYDDESSTNFFSCTQANYREISTGGAFAVISHGAPGEHLVVHAPWTLAGKNACELWQNGDTDLIVREYPNWCYAIVANSNWLTANFKTSTDSNNALTIWSICYSAAMIDSYGNPTVAVKDAAGGRWRIGYELPVCMSEAADINSALLGRMNGTIASGSARTAGKAYADPAVDYRRINTYSYDDDSDGVADRQIGSVRMDGNGWTTLCPAPVKGFTRFPQAHVSGKRRGFGCVLLDTWIDGDIPVENALAELFTSSLSNIRWLNTPEEAFGVGFDFDKSAEVDVFLLLDAENIRSRGGDGTMMDGNYVAPNGDSVLLQF